MLRYTSNSAYNFLKNTFLSQAIHSCVNLSLLRLTTVKPFNVYVIQTIGNDIAILLDEMHLQPQVQFDGQALIGCNADMAMHTSILCYMVVTLKKSIPFVISAIPLVKNSGEIVYQNINKCLSLLEQSQFRVRAIVSDNHRLQIM